MYSSSSDILTKSWAEMLFRFQWQEERRIQWQELRFISKSPQSINKNLNAKYISKLIKENV